MKIIIDNSQFDYEFGLKILKLKYKKCPFEEIKDIWDSIPEAKFEEIAELRNLEERRIAFLYFGTEKLVNSVNPDLVDKTELSKKIEWINKFGLKETIEYKETYELYRINPEYFNTGIITPADNFYFLKVKDTSTDREYIIWVDAEDIRRMKKGQKITALDAVAWTIRTNIPEGNIEQIVRQGEVIMFKVKESSNFLKYERHLTAEEFVKLIKSES